MSAGVKLSGTQRRILEAIESDKNNRCIFDKHKDNISIDMKDLSALTAYTGNEFSMFGRNNSYIIFMGNSRGVYIDKATSDDLILKRYKWIGHTHPGYSIFCLQPSDGDYDTLEKFKQKRSVIYNSIGQYYIFGKGE